MRELHTLTLEIPSASAAWRPSKSAMASSTSWLARNTSTGFCTLSTTSPCGLHTAAASTAMPGSRSLGPTTSLLAMPLNRTRKRGRAEDEEFRSRGARSSRRRGPSGPPGWRRARAQSERRARRHGRRRRRGRGRRGWSGRLDGPARRGRGRLLGARGRKRGPRRARGKPERKMTGRHWRSGRRGRLGWPRRAGAGRRDRGRTRRWRLRR
jgi:hypothetical protein